MDEYLIRNASFVRLVDEYKKYHSLVIAFDFDNTVFDYHKKGSTYWQVIELLRDLKGANCMIICFTANQDHIQIREYCLERQIPLDGININPPFFKGESGKIYFNALLDDRAGLIQVYNELNALIKLIKTKQI